ncbi:MAG: response regulator transcription factor [Flavobacteriia bacterium]|nr:response regulator transcription factor [Flavobacteriia bacterium]OJX34847.1 MAG: hypothetical protein BGO87_08865 [Flavobacteriia bacterium 40-80]
MKILILEDEYLIADMIGIMLKRNGYNSIVHADSFAAASELIEDEPDVCFVDIRLNEDNGIEFAKILQRKEIPFIFITANNEMETIRSAALTNPQAYLSKPVNERDLIASLEIIRAKFSRYLLVRTNMGKVKIRQSDILYIEADNVYSKIVCGSRTYTERITLKEVEKLLEPYFVRVHRSFIVNRNRIDSFKSNELRIENFKIPVSKNSQDLSP